MEKNRPFQLQSNLIHFISCFIDESKSRKVLMYNAGIENQQELKDNIDSSVEIQFFLENSHLSILNEPEEFEANSKTYDENYDLVIGFPTWLSNSLAISPNMLNVNRITPSEAMEIRKLSKKINSNGQLLFFLPSTKLLSNSDNYFRMLSEMNLYLGAAFDVPTTMINGTSLSFYGLAIQKNKVDRVLIAQIPNHTEVQRMIISKYMHNENSKEGAFTYWIDQNGIINYEYHEKLAHIDVIAKQQGYTFSRFSDVVSSISKSKYSKDNFVRMPERKDAIYLPEMGVSRATTSQDDLSPTLKSYYQMTLDLNIAIPEYFAYWLNTSMGKEWREAFIKDTFLPRIDIKRMQNSKVPLLPIDQQQKIVKALSMLKNISSQLDIIKHDLESNILEVQGVINRLHALSYTETFDYWVSELPYPLASILRTYETRDSSYKDKYSRLLHFFEASTIFLACIHLSAYHSNGQIWPAILQSIKKELDGAHKSFVRTDFGSWNMVHGFLTSNTQKILLNEKDMAEKEIYKNMYAVSDISILERLCSKKIRQILEKTNQYRNEWVGHAGNVSDAEAKQRLSILEEVLEGLRLAIANAFSRYRLVQLDKSDNHMGAINYIGSSILVGSNPLFKREDITLKDLYYNDYLHMHETNNSSALRMLKLVVIRKDPMNQCYFYNKLVEGKPFLITYHMAEASSMESDDVAIDMLIEELGAK